MTQKGRVSEEWISQSNSMGVKSFHPFHNQIDGAIEKDVSSTLTVLKKFN
jgi:hypothetical protein